MILPLFFQQSLQGSLTPLLQTQFQSQNRVSSNSSDFCESGGAFFCLSFFCSVLEREQWWHAGPLLEFHKALKPFGPSKR